MSFWIVTDAACDLPRAYVEKVEKFTVMPMTYCMDGKDYPCEPGDTAAWHPFYEALRAGKVATTSQISVLDFEKQFSSLLEKGESVLAIIFSSGLSGTYQAAMLARQNILEKNPEAKLEVVDSLCASVGEGLLVHYALQKRAEGLSMKETAKWLIKNRHRLVHWFTVDTLDTLRRGGRVSATAAFVGGMLDIKPILHVDEKGKLIPMEKVQGRKKSLRKLAEKIVSHAVPWEGQTLFIGHGDCEEEAKYTLAHAKELGFQPKEVQIFPIGAIIGAHSGPGTMAVFFLGEQR